MSSAFTFRVEDMTCGHCVSTIGKLVAGVDQAAMAENDPARRLVSTDSARAGADEFGAALREAGYTPVPVGSGAPA